MLAPKAVVEKFWQAMQSNDYEKASQWLDEHIICDWVLSNERIVGRDNFVAINTVYLANGKWQFVIKRLVAEDNQVVSDVDVTDGVIKATTVTFHTVRGGLISHQIEYWPECYQAPEWRKQRVQTINIS